MPDNNYGKTDLLALLLKAENSIVTFKPPAAGADPPPNPPSLDQPPLNIPLIQEQVAARSATDRTEALFEFLRTYVGVRTKEAIDQLQAVQALGQLQSNFTTLSDRVTVLEDILRRNGLT